MYGDNFVWLHLGKTGGTTVNQYGKLCPELVKFRDGDSKPEKHNTIEKIERRFPQVDFTNKDIILGFRKLESWILSHNNHFLSRDLIVNFDDKIYKEKILEGLVYAKGRDTWVSADSWLMEYLKRPVTHFIRTEHLQEDFIRVFGQYGLKDVDKIRHHTLVKNKAQRWGCKIILSSDQIKNIHNHNPLWSTIQNQLYHGTE